MLFSYFVFPRLLRRIPSLVAFSDIRNSFARRIAANIPASIPDDLGSLQANALFAGQVQAIEQHLSAAVLAHRRKAQSRLIKIRRTADIDWGYGNFVYETIAEFEETTEK